MENITRISDLPDQNNVMGSMSGSMSGSNSSTNLGLPTNYMPINIHPNPYGISTQNPIMKHPENPENPEISEVMQMQKQRLPSRDIPQDTSIHIQDEQIKANYIPKVRFEEDYVRRHEDLTERNMKEYENKNRREKKIDILFNELQTPILIAILFFFFQIPLVNTFFKRFSFLSIYNSDGNYNFNGLLLKSIIFGSVYYVVMKII